MGFAPGKVLSIVFEWLYLAILISCFVLSLGNRPQGSNKFYMSMVIFWAIIMVYVYSWLENITSLLMNSLFRYLLFAAVYISVKSVQFELAKNGGSLSFSSMFQNPLFVNLLVSLASTYILYFVVSFMFIEPWHMFTSVSFNEPIHSSIYWPHSSLSNISCYHPRTSMFSMFTLSATHTISPGALKEMIKQRNWIASRLQKMER